MVVKDIPFLAKMDSLNKVTKSYGICSFCEDDKGNTVYAETELFSHGILTTLNIAFGVHDPKIIQLILQHDKNSFIKCVKDDGTIAHPEYRLKKLNEFYTYHPYHQYSNKHLSCANFIHHIDDLNNMDINYLDHRVVSTTNRILDERIGLLKRYIDTHSRIAYIIILCYLQNDNITDQYKIDMLEFITKCANQLELENITRSIDILLKDGIINRLTHSVQCSDDITSKIFTYAEKILNCAKTISDSMKMLNQEAKKIQEAVSTTLTEIDVQNISVQADIWIGKIISITPT